MEQFDSEKIKQIETKINSAQKYGEQLVDWIEKHLESKMTNEQHEFMALTLSKIIIENPMLILLTSAVQEVIYDVFQLGYRSGWEASKTDSLLGDKK
jgi:hypothetical protein